jgi:hypothetical protein
MNISLFAFLALASFLVQDRPSVVKEGQEYKVIKVPAGNTAHVEFPECGNDEATTVVGDGITHTTSSGVNVAACVFYFYKPLPNCQIGVYHDSGKGWYAVSEKGEAGTQPEYALFIRHKNYRNPEDQELGCRMEFRNWRSSETQFLMVWQR